MAAIKSLVASALLAFLLAPAALADDPAVRVNADDQAWAAQTLLRSSDFRLGWQGGATRPAKPTGFACPGFEPKASDLVVTGYASVSFDNPRIGVQISVDSQVLEHADAVQTDFARTIQPPLLGCLAYQLKRQPNIVAVAVEKLDFPKIGTITAAYRATITLRSKGRTAKVLSDFVFFANGRLEYSMRVDAASVRYRPQLVPFEVDLARMIVKRGTRPE